MLATGRFLNGQAGQACDDREIRGEPSEWRDAGLVEKADKRGVLGPLRLRGSDVRALSI